jgi:hypothetical protein
MRRTWTTWAATTGLDGRDDSGEPGADEERAGGTAEQEQEQQPGPDKMQARGSHCSSHSAFSRASGSSRPAKHRCPRGAEGL